MPLLDLTRKSRYVADAEKTRRVKICKECPMLTKLQRCKQCGCFVGLKTRLTTERCPLEKW